MLVVSYVGDQRCWRSLFIMLPIAMTRCAPWPAPHQVHSWAVLLPRSWHKRRRQLQFSLDSSTESIRGKDGRYYLRHCHLRFRPWPYLGPCVSIFFPYRLLNTYMHSLHCLKEANLAMDLTVLEELGKNDKYVSYNASLYTKCACTFILAWFCTLGFSDL